MEEERTYPVDCVCGKENLSNEYLYTKHLESKAHETAMLQRGFVYDDDGGLVELPEDLKAALDVCYESPIMAAKMVRAAFAVREWPNKKHPGTVRDFMNQHGMPCFDIPPGHYSQAEGDQHRQQMIKEYRRNHG